MGLGQILKFQSRVRDVSAGATGATAVAPKFSDTLTLSQPGGGQILPTIAEVEPKFSLCLRPCACEILKRTFAVLHF